MLLDNWKKNRKSKHIKNLFHRQFPPDTKSFK